MTVFTLYLNLSGAVTGAADAAAARAAKTAISAALPVVGGIISDAAGALTAGASLLRGAVGALGAAVVAAVCLVPFLSLGLRYLFYKAAAALASCFAEKRLAELIGEVGSVFALVLGVTGGRGGDALRGHTLGGEGGGRMMGLIGSWVRALTGAALLCTMALALCPKGAPRRVLNSAAACVMALALLSPAAKPAAEDFARAFAQYSRTRGRLRTRPRPPPEAMSGES